MICLWQPKWVQLQNRKLQNWGGLPDAKGVILTCACVWVCVWVCVCACVRVQAIHAQGCTIVIIVCNCRGLHGCGRERYDRAATSGVAQQVDKAGERAWAFWRRQPASKPRANQRVQAWSRCETFLLRLVHRLAFFPPRLTTLDLSQKECSRERERERSRERESVCVCV